YSSSASAVPTSRAPPGADLCYEIIFLRAKTVLCIIADRASGLAEINNDGGAVDVHNWALIAGLVFGSVSISSASYVWIRQQKFGTGGAMLSIAAIVLIGLPFWSSFRFEISESGIKAEFERLRNE